MERLFLEGIISRDTLSFRELYDASGKLILVRLAGTLHCLSNDSEVRIAKQMDVRRGIRNRVEVRTIRYKYHAWFRAAAGGALNEIIRYDNNAHRPGLHVHLFDESGREIESRDIELADMPTLDVFIRHVATASR